MENSKWKIPQKTLDSMVTCPVELQIDYWKAQYEYAMNTIMSLIQGDIEKVMIYPAKEDTNA